VRAAVAAVLGTGAVVSPPVFAQEADQEQTLVLEEIQVTGSRIVRRDAVANAPVVTVGEEILNASSSGSLEVQLTRLPQFVAAETPTTEAGDIQPTATNTPGAATVALRGIGTNRNLVLIDGRRATPSNASMAVDLNTIPSAAIERVEIMTGGASSTYGADAVGGVVNLILKKNFEGLQLDGQYGVTQRGDAEEYNVGGILGTNFADGRGNITVSFSKQERKQAMRRDRGYFRDFWRDTSTGGTEFFPDFPAFSPIGNNVPSQAALDGIFDQAPGAVGPYSRIYFNPDGTAFTGLFLSEIPGGVYRFDPPAGEDSDLKWVVDDRGLLKQNWLNEQLVFPLDRTNFLLRSNYQINDSISLFAQGMFNKSTARTRQQPAPAANGWSAVIPFDGREIPQELEDLLNSRVVDPTGPWQLHRYLDFMGDRTTRTDVFTYNLTVGLQGRLGAGWTWEAFGQEGESETNAYQQGFVSLERYRTIVSAPNWGEGFSFQGNPSQGGFGGSTGTCTSGLSPFIPISQITQDCKDAIAADIKSRSTMKQTIWEVSAQGPLMSLPAGELRSAVGATYRKNDYEFLNDTLTTQGSSFLDQAIGLYPSGNSRGDIVSKEVYAELLVPVIDRVELELGARNSDYNTTGSSFTWKALASWQATDWLRLRGGFNKAERAPNIGELYLALQQTFGFSAGGDVCSLNNTQPWSANPAVNPNAAQVEALCRELMNRSGDPTTADTFYGNPSFQTVGGGFVFPSTRGNPNLTPETAKTWTAGFVFTSPWMNPALNRLNAIVDYYRIRVDDAIGVQSYDLAQRFCFDPAFNPTYDPDTLSCQNIKRNVGVGTLGDVIGTYVNSGRFVTTGIDAQINWAMDLGMGTLSANTTLNYLLDAKSALLPIDPMVEYVGTAGNPGDNGLNGNFYRWQSLTSVSYGQNRWNFGLTWQHLPKLKPVQAVTQPTTSFESTPAYDLFSLHGRYDLGQGITLRFGIENLLDKDPPLTGRNSAPPPGQLAGGTIAVGNYDGLGRRFYLGARIDL
jgi:outer membrane receptor protein involved in Fe transport